MQRELCVRSHFCGPDFPIELLPTSEAQPHSTTRPSFSASLMAPSLDALMRGSNFYPGGFESAQSVSDVGRPNIQHGSNFRGSCRADQMHISISRGPPFPNDSKLRPSGLPFHVHFHPHKITRLCQNINAFQGEPDGTRLTGVCGAGHCC